MSDTGLMKLQIDDNRQLYLNGTKIDGVIDAGLKTDYSQLTNGEAVLNIQMIVNVEELKGRAVS